MILTVWAYLPRLRGSKGAWRWLALASGWPRSCSACSRRSGRRSTSPRRRSSPAAIVFLIDSERSLRMGDEVNGQTRWQVAVKALREAKKSVSGAVQGPRDQGISLRFGPPRGDRRRQDGARWTRDRARVELARVREAPDRAQRHHDCPHLGRRQQRGHPSPDGRYPAQGAADPGRHGRRGRRERRGRLEGHRDPLVRGRPDRLRQESARNPRDPRARASRTGRSRSSFTSRARVWSTARPSRPRPAPTRSNVSGFKYLPQLAGEKRLEMRVKPQDGELVKSNNSFATYLTVLKGGLKVLYLQGPNFTWEIKHLVRGLDAAKEIHGRHPRRPPAGGRGPGYPRRCRVRFGEL